MKRRFLLGVVALPLIFIGGSLVFFTIKNGKTPFETARAAQFAAAGMLSESEVAARLAKDPGDPIAHYNLAEKASQRKDFTKAIEERKLALLHEPENPQLLLDTALDLRFAQRNDEARVYAERVIATKDPNLTPNAQKLLEKLNTLRKDSDQAKSLRLQ